MTTTPEDLLDYAKTVLELTAQDAEINDNINSAKLYAYVELFEGCDAERLAGMVVAMQLVAHEATHQIDHLHSQHEHVMAEYLTRVINAFTALVFRVALAAWPSPEGEES